MANINILAAIRSSKYVPSCLPFQSPNLLHTETHPTYPPLMSISPISRLPSSKMQRSKVLQGTSKNNRQKVGKSMVRLRPRVSFFIYLYTDLWYVGYLPIDGQSVRRCMTKRHISGHSRFVPSPPYFLNSSNN